MKMVCKKCIAAVLALTLALGLGACAKTGGGSGGGGSTLTQSDLRYWTVPVTQKVMRDEDYADKGAAKVTVKLYKNETEAGQLLLTPAQDVASLTVSVSDLKTAGGETLSKDAVTVYWQMYVEVKTLSNGEVSTFPRGWYPDALLPMDAAVRCGENTVKAGENQCLYLAVTTPKDQAAGVYTGSVTVTTDGISTSVPMEVTVWDWTMSEVNHLRTMFGMRNNSNGGYGGIFEGELDTTPEMYEKYYDYFKDYRINMRFLPGVPNGARADDINEVVEAIYEATMDPMVSTYCLPHAYNWAWTDIDRTYFDEVIQALVKGSMEKKADLLKKAATYFTAFDEANGDPAATARGQSIMNYVNDYFNTFDAKFRKKYQKLSCWDETIFDECMASLDNMTKLFVSNSTTDNFAQKDYDYTWCPTFNCYNNEDSRNFFLHGDNEAYEKWWYGCMTPRNPFPNYQIDEWGWSPRVVSWMQYDYGVVGNLFWECTYWVSGRSSLQKVQDIYNYADQYTGINGDGYLVYPGKYYGIDGPVGCIRLHAIRDGMEDYEAMYALEQKTNEILPADVEGSTVSALSTIMEGMFTGTIIHTDAEKIDAARETVAQLLTAADKYGVVITANEADGNNRKFTVYAKEGTTISAEGASSQAVTGGTLYTILAQSKGNDSTCAITMTKDGESFTVDMPLGKQRISFTGSSLEKGMTFGDKQTTAHTDGDDLVVEFALADNQNIRFVDADMFAMIDPETTVFYITVTASKDCTIELFTVSNNMSYGIGDMTVTAGEKKTLTAQLSTSIWSMMGNSISAMRFSITATEPVTLTIHEFAMQQ